MLQLQEQLSPKIWTVCMEAKYLRASESREDDKGSARVQSFLPADEKRGDRGPAWPGCKLERAVKTGKGKRVQHDCTWMLGIQAPKSNEGE